MGFFTDEELAYLIGNTECKSKKDHSGKSAEEMLKKALEFAYQESLPDCEFTRGMNCAKRQMAAHLEMLIK